MLTAATLATQTAIPLTMLLSSLVAAVLLGSAVLLQWLDGLPRLILLSVLSSAGSAGFAYHTRMEGSQVATAYHVLAVCIGQALALQYSPSGPPNVFTTLLVTLLHYAGFLLCLRLAERGYTFMSSLIPEACTDSSSSSRALLSDSKSASLSRHIGSMPLSPCIAQQASLSASPVGANLEKKDVQHMAGRQDLVVVLGDQQELQAAPPVVWYGNSSNSNMNTNSFQSDVSGIQGNHHSNSSVIGRKIRQGAHAESIGLFDALFASVRKSSDVLEASRSVDASSRSSFEVSDKDGWKSLISKDSKAAAANPHSPTSGRPTTCVENHQQHRPGIKMQRPIQEASQSSRQASHKSEPAVNMKPMEQSPFRSPGPMGVSMINDVLPENSPVHGDMSFAAQLMHWYSFQQERYEYSAGSFMLHGLDHGLSSSLVPGTSPFLLDGLLAGPVDSQDPQASRLMSHAGFKYVSDDVVTQRTAASTVRNSLSSVHSSVPGVGRNSAASSLIQDRASEMGANMRWSLQATDVDAIERPSNSDQVGPQSARTSGSASRASVEDTVQRSSTDRQSLSRQGSQRGRLSVENSSVPSFLAARPHFGRAFTDVPDADMPQHLPLARRLLSTVQEAQRERYQPVSSHATVRVKVRGVTPDDAPANLLDQLQQHMSIRDPNFLLRGVSVRRGCINLTLDIEQLYGHSDDGCGALPGPHPLTPGAGPSNKLWYQVGSNTETLLDCTASPPTTCTLLDSTHSTITYASGCADGLYSGDVDASVEGRDSRQRLAGCVVGAVSDLVASIPAAQQPPLGAILSYQDNHMLRLHTWDGHQYLLQDTYMTQPVPLPCQVRSIASQHQSLLELDTSTSCKAEEYGFPKASGDSIGSLSSVAAVKILKCATTEQDSRQGPTVSVYTSTPGDIYDIVSTVSLMVCVPTGCPVYGWDARTQLPVIATTNPLAKQAQNGNGGLICPVNATAAHCERRRGEFMLPTAPAFSVSKAVTGADAHPSSMSVDHSSSKCGHIVQAVLLLARSASGQYLDVHVTCGNEVNPADWQHEDVCGPAHGYQYSQLQVEVLARRSKCADSGRRAGDGDGRSCKDATGGRDVTAACHLEMWCDVQLPMLSSVDPQHVKRMYQRYMSKEMGEMFDDVTFVQELQPSYMARTASQVRQCAAHSARSRSRPSTEVFLQSLPICTIQTDC